MDVAAYLRRINYQGPLKPTAETLRALQLAHLYSVPFENLDIHLGQRIVLDEERFFEKIVVRRRGGFCYELNGLFAALLRELGFKVSRLSARVPREDGSPTPEFDHMALRVDIEQPWLADVGCGDSFLQPMPLHDGAECRQLDADYSLADEGHRWMVIKRLQEFQWKLLYEFTLGAHELPEFAGMCEWQQTSPQSPFVKRRICTLAVPTGRITLANMRLIVTENGVRTERELNREQDYFAALRKYFDVDLGSGPVIWQLQPDTKPREIPFAMQDTKTWKF